MISYIFRHGECKYAQEKVSLSEANDLTLKGIEIVAASADHLVNILKGTREVKLHSSRFGRCLHTSKIIGYILNNKGIAVPKIILDDDLEEVINFQWNLFCPLVIGGEVDYQGDKFVIDKSTTNPQGLSTVRYFRQDLAHKLPQSVRAKLPGLYLQRVDSFEPYKSVHKRLEDKLRSLNGTNIIVTHEGLTGEFIEKLSQNEDAYLGRGMYFGVKSQNEKLIPFLTQENAIETDA